MRHRWSMGLAALGMPGAVMALEQAKVEYSADQTLETAAALIGFMINANQLVRDEAVIRRIGI